MTLDFDDGGTSSDVISSSSSTYQSVTPRKSKPKPTPTRKKVMPKKEKTIFPVSSSLDAISIGTKRPSASDIKIIGGRGYDVRQPIPVKYTQVRERFLNARKNFWIPNEIPMGEDKLQWNTAQLTETEMWLFKTNISYLTASDNLVPDNLDNAILGHITANEMRQYFRHQIMEESNHIESYLFILESFGLDEEGQGKIFGLYQETPALTEKLNWNLTFTNNVVNSEAPRGTPEANRAVLEDLISYYIFEYLFFPLGFSQIFALARKGKLRNTAQQYSYIWRDECYSADTEILTTSGWKLFSDLTSEDKVAQFNKDRTIEFVTPSRMVDYDHDGSLIHFSNKKGTINFLVTPNHRVVWERHEGHHLSSLPPRTTLACDMTMGNRKHFIMGGIKVDGRTDLTPYERFLIAFQADGSFSGGSRKDLYTGERTGYKLVSFTLKKERKKERLREILQDCGFPFTQVDNPINKQGFTIFRIHAPVDVSKTFDWVNIDSISYEWARDFIREAAHWDGHLRNGDYSHILYTTTEKFNADVVQALAVIAGWRSNRSIQIDNRKDSYKDIYKVSVITTTDTIDTGGVSKTEVPYNGKVYCVTVPSGMLVVRRDGKVIVNGNSLHSSNGLWLIKQIIQENPELWDSAMQERSRAIVSEAVKLETAYAHASMPDGGIVGLPVKTYIKYSHFVADNICKNLGLKPLFRVRQHPMSWISEYELNHEVNFFEGRVREYQTGSQLSWD